MKKQTLDIRQNPYIKAILQPGGIEHTCTYVKSEGRVYIKTASCTFCVDLNGDEVSVIEEKGENRALQEIAKFVTSEATRFVEIEKLREEMEHNKITDAEEIGDLREEIGSLKQQVARMQFSHAAQRGAWCKVIADAKALSERWQKSSVSARRQDGRELKKVIKKSGVNWRHPQPKDEE